jgi:hypothetical protein
MLREDQQQLVIEADGLLDPLSDPVAGLHVFRGEPAAHASALQVGVEPLGEVLVFTGITQKAGVILDRALRERPGVGDEGIGEAGSTQEDFGQLSVRPFDGIRPDCRRAHVLQRLQSVHGAQIKPTEDRPIDDSSAEGGSAEVGSAEGGSAEGGFEEVSKAEVGSAEDGSAEVDSTEVGVAEVDSTGAKWRSAPLRSGWNSICCCLQVFQIPSPRRSRSRCSWLAIVRSSCAVLSL